MVSHEGQIHHAHHVTRRRRVSEIGYHRNDCFVSISSETQSSIIRRFRVAQASMSQQLHIRLRQERSTRSTIS